MNLGRLFPGSGLVVTWWWLGQSRYAPGTGLSLKMYTVVFVPVPLPFGRTDVGYGPAHSFFNPVWTGLKISLSRF